MFSVTSIVGVFVTTSVILVNVSFSASCNFFNTGSAEGYCCSTSFGDIGGFSSIFTCINNNKGLLQTYGNTDCSGDPTSTLLLNQTDSPFPFSCDGGNDCSIYSYSRTKCDDSFGEDTYLVSDTGCYGDDGIGMHIIIDSDGLYRNYYQNDDCNIDDILFTYEYEPVDCIFNETDYQIEIELVDAPKFTTITVDTLSGCGNDCYGFGCGGPDVYMLMRAYEGSSNDYTQTYQYDTEDDIISYTAESMVYDDQTNHFMINDYNWSVVWNGIVSKIEFEWWDSDFVGDDDFLGSFIFNNVSDGEYTTVEYNDESNCWESLSYTVSYGTTPATTPTLSPTPAPTDVVMTTTSSIMSL